MIKLRELLIMLIIGTVIITVYAYSITVADRFHISEQSEKAETVQATMVFAGDVMVHDTQFEAAYCPEDDAYDFNPCFLPVKPLLEEADLAVVNLETTLAGEDREYTGYPLFNTPESLAAALKNAGFDLVSTANNHSLDRGEHGVIKTIEHLKEAGLKSFGTYLTQEERDRPLIVNVNGIKAAFLSYTYGTNGIPLPENKDYLVNLLDPELIIADIHRARNKADMVVLYIHWGLEYHREPSVTQRSLAARFISEGADIIVGNHPHVVQPVEFIKHSCRGELREGIVAYSLGNFTGDQIEPYTDTGIMLYVVVERKNFGDKVDIIEVSYVPTWIHRFHFAGKRYFRVLPILPQEEYWRQIEQDPHVCPAAFQKLKEVQAEMSEHLRYVPQGLPGSRLPSATVVFYH